jgi:UDPglucose--hexose-1-phosphate uridylyltransferase
MYAVDLTSLQGKSHRRYNPLTREWILVSPNRTERPWQGQIEKIPAASLPAYDPACYLCPGNQRAGKARNPSYDNTFIFDNDFAALQPNQEPIAAQIEGSGLLLAATENGICRVVCFSPRHDLTLAQMPASAITKVVEVWAEQYRTLGSLPDIRHVQIFENRGAMMGCSNPHPHGQIWATESIPNEPRKEQKSLQEYWNRNHRCLLCEYVKIELSEGERIVCQNDLFLAVVPFWATWPFETLLLSKRHVASIDTLDPAEQGSLAQILKELTTRYDNLFHTSFPYSMGFHQSPTDGADHEEWHFHAHFYPPLLRSATIRKFMVGFEMLAAPQRDMTPELAAERLREVSGPHYSMTTQPK